MHQYCDRKSSTSKVTTTDPPAQPAPVSKFKLVPTWFMVKDSIYNKRKSAYNESSVEAEFQRYKLGLLSSEETSIL
jgi:hypothetical protein